MKLRFSYAELGYAELNYAELSYIGLCTAESSYAVLTYVE